MRAEWLNILHGNVFGNLKGNVRGNKPWEAWQAPIQASSPFIIKPRHPLLNVVRAEWLNILHGNMFGNLKGKACPHPASRPPATPARPSLHGPAHRPLGRQCDCTAPPCLARASLEPLSANQLQHHTW